MDNFTPLTAISPVEGRYSNKTKELANYFSEAALIKYRIYVELEYFIALCEIPLPQLKNTASFFDTIRKIHTYFSHQGALRVKEIEKTTNHDIKAVEYFIKEKFEEMGLHKQKEFIHFGLTSQDVNNTATPLLIKDAINDSYYPLLDTLIDTLKALAKEWDTIPMLAHTHGQPASPTRLGKEVNVFVERLEVQLSQLKAIPFSAKFGGATGNFNAHHVAYPNIDWKTFANGFVNDTLELQRSQVTTQIEHYDNLAALFDNLKRINTILLDLTRDFWTYISMNYFKQKTAAGEVGSSAMPHKINPIDFENAEGNFGVANALFEHLSAKLPISRLQRDLTDSTVLRNVGVPFAHTRIAFYSLLKGLGKLIVNDKVIEQDLNENWSVVAEAIQTVLRREGYPNPYEALKDLTRTNDAITQQIMADFINQLDIAESVKEELMQITPQNYTGI